jgi:hypothetical protein
LGKIDEGLGAVAEGFSMRPELKSLAPRMQKIHAEYQALINEAAKLMQGGSADQLQRPQMQGGSMPSPMPMRDMTRGMPASPAGPF